MLKIASVIIISVLAAELSFAQETIPKTSTTDIDAKIKKKKERPEGKRHYMKIIKTNTKNTLYGNKCFEDFTRQLGFTYENSDKRSIG